MKNSPAKTQEIFKEQHGFTSAFAEVNGTTLHYVEGGEGSPLFLLPGWPETWWAYHKVMPLLANNFRVIAVDIRGMGASGRPLGGYDKKNMAQDIFELMRQLNLSKVNICGHDIGAHVAFSFAANFPEQTNRLIMIDTPHPDESMYQLPMLPIPGLNYTYPWWLAFNQVRELPGILLEGRMNHVIDWIFSSLLTDQNMVSEDDKAIYTLAYDNKDSIRASNAWYQAFNQDIQDIKSYSRLNIPTLGLASADSFDMLNTFLQHYVADHNLKKIENTGHFMTEEQPEEVSKQIISFLL